MRSAPSSTRTASPRSSRQTTEEWDAVRNAAYVVAESGNLLMMSSRAKDGGDWMTMSQALIDVGQRAIRAAESHDKTAVFDVGAEVYDACTNCHAKYALGDPDGRTIRAAVDGSD